MGSTHHNTEITKCSEARIPNLQPHASHTLWKNTTPSRGEKEESPVNKQTINNNVPDCPSQSGVMCISTAERALRLVFINHVVNPRIHSGQYILLTCSQFAREHGNIFFKVIHLTQSLLPQEGRISRVGNLCSKCKFPEVKMSINSMLTKRIL